MKKTEFSHLEETCPKCNNTIMLEKASWSDLSGSLYYVFCEPCHCKGTGAKDKKTALANFHKELARKEKLALRKPEKILTDIRDYLLRGKSVFEKTTDFESVLFGAGVQVFIDKALADLTEYAEKLGVEL